MELGHRFLWIFSTKHLVELNADALIADLLEDAVPHLRVLRGHYDFWHDLELEPVCKSDCAQDSQWIVQEGLQRLERRSEQPCAQI